METNQQFSCCNQEMRRFVFNRLQQTDNQKTLYTLRLISKSEQERVEKKIQTAKINFCNVEKFATSKFSSRIKFLKVSLRKSQDCYENFKYLSNTFLPYALNIYVKAYSSIFGQIILEMHEPLTFQCLHINNYVSQLPNIFITGKYNVEIRDCEFIGIGVDCYGNADVQVTGSKFINATFGLRITYCDSMCIDEITLDKCPYGGLIVSHIQEVINIANVRVFSSANCGIILNRTGAKFKLSNTIIKDCSTGILVSGPFCGEIQKTNIEGRGFHGICISGGAIVHYAEVEFKHNKQDVRIRDDGSQFLQLENI